MSQGQRWIRGGLRMGGPKNKGGHEVHKNKGGYEVHKNKDGKEVD
eukprot:CAMPEP_0206505334 /NCGR_PEP_ID=MMETSP0324_2-20121206/56063_1 /ASSEMBLY_ACC=CAM_ASM_000836 /TAXON_ID=2866 /ORGANISM="Crypthecodinium cohnii, Strain Seligo" /LENGTH=44 /DNA_ID= /DNA_START= /DNA_END= /DNA_ORIENTATION=